LQKASFPESNSLIPDRVCREAIFRGPLPDFFLSKDYSRSKNKPYATFTKPQIEMGTFQIKNVSGETPLT